MVVVVAMISAKPDSRTELLDSLKELVEHTRLEDGCIQYDLHVSSTDPLSFLFYERWSSAEALEAHLSTPHIERAFAAGELYAAGPTTIMEYELLS